MLKKIWSCLLQVVWKGDEIWLETELLHFSVKSMAKALKRFVIGRRRSSPTATTPGTPSPAPATPTNPTTTVSLTPLGSGRYPPGTIEVCNATKVSGRVRALRVHSKYSCCFERHSVNIWFGWEYFERNLNSWCKLPRYPFPPRAQEDLEYALIPETFRTEASAADARETNANLEAAGMVGAGAGHRAEHSSSSAQQVSRGFHARVYSSIQ